MDSDRGGGLQSSSRGDDDYQLRAALNALPVSSPLPPPSFFDPQSNTLCNTDTHIQPNSLWPGSTSMRSDPYPGGTLSGDSATFQPPPALDFTNPVAARNPKKRSRASRRAPTTVLTTDTTNFRAMVQEFTGIPAHPFSNSSFQRTRFDLFGTASSVPDAAHNRRPFIQKFHSPAAAFPTTPSPSFAHLNSNPISTNFNPPLLNFKHSIPQNLPNPLRNSLLQTNPKHLFWNSSDPKIDGADEFGLSSEINLPDLSSSDILPTPSDRNRDNKRNSEQHRGVEQPQVFPIIDGFNRNYSTQPNFHGAQESQNVSLPGEGTTEPWMCSSD